MPVSAQDCFYQLRLTDSEGDGWNAGALTVRVGGTSFTYTLDATNDDGASRDFFVPVNDGDAVVIGFEAGAFPEEVGFSVLDNNDSLIYEVTAPATDAELTTFTAACRSCAPPPRSSIELYRIRFNSVDIRFRSTPGDPTYRIEYGEGEFDPTTDTGTEILTQDTMLRVSGLEPLTTYRFFVTTICNNPADTTVRRGPFRIDTPIRRDVGITELRRPVSKCQPAATDSVTVGITNFGGEPQQFIRLDFTVNGEPSGVQMPFDGIYTGVVSPDSTEYFTFDARADLRQAGFYEFQVFTMLEEDENVGNDTLTASVVSLPVISQFPYLESFETGDGFWFTEQGGRGPVSWERGEPRGQRIDRAGSGDFAYVTNAGGPYNDDERSYLLSPCFNFLDLEEDPYLSFLLSVDTEEEFDGLHLEASTDGGDTWELVERNPSGVNWYNNGLQQVWDGNGGFGEGYSLVGQQLRGYAGEDQVRLRFVFTSDGDVRREGVAIDNIRITDRPQVDYAVTRVSLINEANCFNEFDTVQIRLARLGEQSVDSVLVYYSLNGDPAVVERAPAPQTYGEQQTYNFDVRLQFGSASRDRNRLVAWVEAEGDSATYNDTVLYRFMLAQPLPFLADFEDRRVPRSWEIPSDIVIAARPGSPSVALTDNLSADDTEMAFTTANYGPVAQGDEFVFTLRQRDADGNPVSGGIENLTVNMIVDCGSQTIPIVSVANPGDSTFVVSMDTVFLVLNEVSDPNIYFEFLVEWGSGDFYAMIDDIAVRRCPDDLDLRYTTAPPSGIFADDGTAYVLAGAGLPPYTYSWSNGDTTQSADSLSVAEYAVTVTDALGCSETLDVEVDLTAVATSDPDDLLSGLEAFPNPTAGRVDLRLELPGPLDLGLEVYDGAGRRIERRSLGKSNSLATFIELTDRTPGLYLIRVHAGEATRTVRVIKR
ncbi:putative secreted protein (Por secretion system target) [Neolewinella xylanilytica]|uniref:Putative secreted protein (Por secretion system target) n=2 Tax=Neolewinella xylanilytica TaxID=1514080 RepID=A0A2S6I1Z1_9BACT|nr:putative secreted protein (Por secretion system target) [Neolewinella xylanilytica]